MIFIVVVFLAKYAVILPVIIYLYCILVFSSKRKYLLVSSIILFLLSLLMAKIVGAIFYNPRPFVVGHFTPLISHAADNGFPSDHALLVFAIAFTLFSVQKKMAYLCFLIGILISIARIYAGIHSTIDILGSFLITGFAFYFTDLLLKSNVMRIYGK